jgi:hypothetical protein
VTLSLVAEVGETGPIVFDVPGSTKHCRSIAGDAPGEDTHRIPLSQ